METTHATHWSKHIRPFLVAVLIACIASATIVIPVTHASSHTTYNEHYEHNDSITCNGFRYLGGTWPARFHLGDCAIKKLKKNSWIVNTLGAIGAVLSKIPVVKIGVTIITAWLGHEIDQIYDMSNKCNGAGVYIDFYTAYFQYHSVC